MAYRKTGKRGRKTYGGNRYTAKKAKRRAAPKRKFAAKRAAPRGQKITLVIQQAPVTPMLATPAAKAAPKRARFGG